MRVPSVTSMMSRTLAVCLPVLLVLPACVSTSGSGKVFTSAPPPQQPTPVATRDPAPAPEPEIPITESGRSDAVPVLATPVSMGGDSIPTARPANAFVRPRNPAVLTRDEILPLNFPMVYAVVVQLRGDSWLKNRVVESPDGTRTPIQVYLDGKRMPDGLNALKSTLSRDVQTLTWVEPKAAQRRWGADHMAGAILVVTAVSGVRLQPAR